MEIVKEEDVEIRDAEITEWDNGDIDITVYFEGGGLMSFTLDEYKEKDLERYGLLEGDGDE